MGAELFAACASLVAVALGVEHFWPRLVTLSRRVRDVRWKSWLPSDYVEAAGPPLRVATVAFVVLLAYRAIAVAGVQLSPDAIWGDTLGSVLRRLLLVPLCCGGIIFGYHLILMNEHPAVSRYLPMSSAVITGLCGLLGAAGGGPGGVDRSFAATIAGDILPAQAVVALFAGVALAFATTWFGLPIYRIIYEDEPLQLELPLQFPDGDPLCTPRWRRG